MTTTRTFLLAQMRDASDNMGDALRFAAGLLYRGDVSEADVLACMGDESLALDAELLDATQGYDLPLVSRIQVALALPAEAYAAAAARADAGARLAARLAAA